MLIIWRKDEQEKFVYESVEKTTDESSVKVEQARKKKVNIIET